MQRGRRLKSGDHIHGLTPYVSSSATNNGVDDFVGNKEGVRTFEDCISIANSGSVGSSFYQPFAFVASDHVTKLKTPRGNKYVYLYLAALTQRLSEKYSFNREIKESRLFREKFLLPVDSKGNLNYEYMENFMKNVECSLLNKYITNRLNEV